MDLHLMLDSHDVLEVRLTEGGQRATVSVASSRAGARSLARALDAASADGYGECFWPGSTGGQYWWIFKRDGESLEVVVMWTRGGASLWEHVFRATDATSWVRDRLGAEVERLNLASPPDV
jgi:hypothetical protein